MKRKELLSVLVAAAGITAVSTASAAIHPDDAVAYEQAVANGSISQLQDFLSQNPSSPYASEALGNIIQVAVGNAQGYAKSGNPKAAGGPDNPGVGNPHTPAC